MLSVARRRFLIFLIYSVVFNIVTLGIYNCFPILKSSPNRSSRSQSNVSKLKSNFCCEQFSSFLFPPPHPTLSEMMRSSNSESSDELELVSKAIGCVHLFQHLGYKLTELEERLNDIHYMFENRFISTSNGDKDILDQLKNIVKLWKKDPRPAFEEVRKELHTILTQLNQVSTNDHGLTHPDTDIITLPIHQSNHCLRPASRDF